MPPKAADQSKGAAGKPPQKTAPLLQLPDHVLSSVNGQHNPLDNGDINGLDQEESPDGLHAMLGMLVNDDDDPEDLQEFEDLRSVLAQVVKSKQNKAQKKQQALLQELQDSTTREVQALEAAVTKDHKQLTNSLTAATATGKKKLQEKFQAMQEMSNKFQQDINAAWEDYSRTFNKVNEGHALAAAQMEKVHAGHKRKVAELRNSLQTKLEETERKVARLSGKVAKAPVFGGMLKQLMTSD